MVSVCFQNPLRRVGSRVNRVMLTAAAHRIASRGSYENHNKAGGARERDDSREWVGKKKKRGACTTSIAALRVCGQIHLWADRDSACFISRDLTP